MRGMCTVWIRVCACVSCPDPKQQKDTQKRYTGYFIAILLIVWIIATTAAFLFHKLELVI